MILDDLLGIDPQNPVARRARMLLEADRNLTKALVARRKALGLSQAEVAHRMDSDQSTVARIEAGGRDMHQSTLRRYAMAVEAFVEHVVIFDDSASRSRGAFAAELTRAHGANDLRSGVWLNAGEDPNYSEDRAHAEVGREARESRRANA